MVEPNFIAIGRIPGECIFIHKDDVFLLDNDENTSLIKCIAIDFISGKTSIPVTIEQIGNICPHDPVTSEGEQEIINELVREVLSEKKIRSLNKRFEKIKYRGQSN